MRPTMPVTPEQIAAQRATIAELNSMVADGVRQVVIRGQATTYNTTDSLIKARNDARTELRRLEQEYATEQGVSGYQGRVQYLHYAGRGYD